MIVGILLGGFNRRAGANEFPLSYGCSIFNALGYVCGGPLPNQVLLSRWFKVARQGDGIRLHRDRRRRNDTVKWRDG